MTTRRWSSARRKRSWHTRNVSSAVIDNPILNSPFAEPSRHWELDENGIPTGSPAPGRRRSEFVVPVPPPKHKVKAQASLDLEDEYPKKNSVRVTGPFTVESLPPHRLLPADEEDEAVLDPPCQQD